MIRYQEILFYIKFYLTHWCNLNIHYHSEAQLSGVLEYINYISEEGWGSPNECPKYNTKQPDTRAPVMLGLWEIGSTPSLP